MPGRLDDAESPYLRRAAAQPIDWHRFAPELLASGRPVLLVIGHPASHACAAFDDECFDDRSLARDLDAHFLLVRIDACERPDLDAQYQGLAEDGGGWPLLCVLDGDGTPRRVLGRLPRARLSSLFAEAQAPGTPLLSSTAPADDRSPALATDAIAHDPSALVHAGSERIRAALEQHGLGFGPPPRHPHAPALSLLLDHSEPAAALALRLLDALLHGGIHDHLGGGFHHSSTDARWIVPHFEKHALDQAVMLDLLARRPETRAARDAILGYVSERLTRPGGGYAMSEAADSGSYEYDASYYTWTVEQARAALPDATDFAIGQRRFDIFGRGELHSDPTRNVLFIAMSEEAIARELGLAVPEITQRLPAIITALRAARDARPRPPLDANIYVAASARLARACLAHERTRAHALETLALLASRPSRGWLADDAQLGLAAHAAHQLTADPRHLALARACLARVTPRLSSAAAWLARDDADASPLALAGQLQLALSETAAARALICAHLPTAWSLGARGAGLIALAARSSNLQ